MTKVDESLDDRAGSPDQAAAVPAVLVAVDSRLSDDYLLVTPLSVNDSVAAPLSIAVSSDGASLFQFAILDGFGACEVQATASGAAGYVPAQLPAGADATEIVSFADSDGVHAWYATSEGLAHATRDPAGTTWTPQQGIPGTVVTSLAAVPTAVPGQWAVTALDSGGSLVLCTADNGWAPATVSLSPPMLKGSARLQYASISGWVLFAADGSGPLNIWEGSQTEIVSGPTQVTLAAGALATQVLCTHVRAGTALAICVDQDQNLYGSVSYSDQPVLIGSTKVAQGAGTVDSSGYLHFYGADGNGGLWVLHQTGWQGTAPVWAPIFPLDADVGQVAVPALPGARPAVSAMRVGGSLDLLSQPGASQMWSRVPIQAPAGTADIPAQLTRYRTRLTASDASGVPAPGTKLTLTPSALVALEVVGQTVIAAPDAPVTLAADGTGAVEFSQPATGLDAVTFTVSVPGLPAQFTVTPHDYLASQLSGAAPIFTGTAAIPAMSAATLRNAEVAGDPLFPAITQVQASVVAQATQSVYAVVAGTSAATSYSLDLRQPGNPRFTVDGPPPADFAELEADGFWSEIGTFFGDVLHAIKQGALTLVGWYVDVTEQVITLTVQITEDVVATLSAISLIDMAAAVSLVHGLFGWLGAPLAKVLDWLKDQLPWADIWSTMETFSDYITGGLNFAASLLEYKAVIASGDFFARLKSELDSHLVSAAELLGSTPLRPPGNAAQAAMPPVTLPGSATTQNWLLSKLWAAAPGGSLLTDPGDTVTAVIGQVEAAITASGIEQDAAAAVANLSRLVSAFFGDPGSLGGTVAGDLILAVKGLADVVIDSADVLISIVLDLAGDAISAALTVLDTPLGEVPLLTWLWENVLRPAGSTEQMTLGKLISLLFAIPVTLVQALTQSLDQEAGWQDAGLAGLAEDMDTLTFWQKTCSMMLVVVDMVNDLFSATNLTTPATIVWNWIDVAANVLVNVLFWPDASIFTGNWDWDQMKAGDAVSTATWCGYWVAIGIDAGFTVKETVTAIRGGGGGGDGGGLPGAAVGENLNYWMDCAAGVVLIALGIAGASLQLAEDEPGVTWLDVLEGFLGPLPWASQPLLCETAVEQSYGASVAVQALIDFFGDMDFG
jgi:hypothetical protein